MRRCDSCGTPLPGRKFHGYPKAGGIVCGRSSTEQMVRLEDGSVTLKRVPTPRCKP